jgi:glycosyltransferase involved in cell wall biosynthesis
LTRSSPAESSIVVTIGFCVRNCEGSIESAVESAANQDFPKEQMEMILVDDGSTDKTLQTIEAIVPKIGVANKIYHHEWRGIGFSRNLVVRIARGEYIAWVDGDMKLPPNHMKKQVEHMGLNPRMGAAKARYSLIDSEKLVVALENARAFDVRPGDRRSLFGTGGAIYRTRAIREAGGFDETIRGAGEDIDALVKIMKNGWLISTSDAEIHEQYKDRWGALWRQYSWWGYGAHFVSHRHKGVISIMPRLPPMSLLLGIFRFFRIYKSQPRLIYLLLPLHSVFKETAWLSGFVNAHLDGYKN